MALTGKEIALAIVVPIVLGVVFATGRLWWFDFAPGLAPAPTATAPVPIVDGTPTPTHPGPSTTPSNNPGVLRFVGGCSPFNVYAQNHWLPYGAAIHSAPSKKSKQIGSRDPNQSITVDGWVHGEVAYTTNRAPFNNDAWFHLADGAGWLSFAGVRAVPTEPDLTLHDSGGTPAAIQPDCQGSAQ